MRTVRTLLVRCAPAEARTLQVESAQSQSFLENAVPDKQTNKQTNKQTHTQTNKLAARFVSFPMRTTLLGHLSRHRQRQGEAQTQLTRRWRVPNVCISLEASRWRQEGYREWISRVVANTLFITTKRTARPDTQHGMGTVVV